MGSKLDDTCRCAVVFRLYNQLEEVKQRKAMQERQQIYAQNREKRREFEKVFICMYIQYVSTHTQCNGDLHGGYRERVHYYLRGHTLWVTVSYWPIFIALHYCRL